MTVGDQFLLLDDTGGVADAGNISGSGQGY
jgi:hypothetical protein